MFKRNLFLTAMVLLASFGITSIAMSGQVQIKYSPAKSSVKAKKSVAEAKKANLNPLKSDSDSKTTKAGNEDEEKCPMKAF